MNLRHRLSFPIVQFSPPRTGSTLVWNVLRELFPARKIKKRHSLKKTRLGPFRLPIVCTVRHPLDAIASCIQCRELPLTDESIDMLIEEFDRLAIKTVLNIRTDPHLLILKYEQFSADFDFLFDELERFFKCAVDPEKRNQIRDKYDVKKVKQKTEQMGAFDNWSAEDHLHGRHISKYNGASGYYREFFSDEQILRMQAHYQDYLKVFGYSE
jgi:hypothetical protein